MREQWSSRELERQFKTALFERTVLGPAKVSAVLSQIHPEALSVFKDSYVLDLLFFHRGLNCLVAIALKIGRFEPEYLGKRAAHEIGWFDLT